MNSIGKILLRPALAVEMGRCRQMGKQIVFTNGCFDLLHVGHMRFLAQARALGDLLVVGVNTDDSIRQIKGPTRPIVPEMERAEMLAHLTAVDYVSLFDERLPNTLIEVVRPSVHVKGGDYRAEDLPETEVVMRCGGRVIILPLSVGVSTTILIERISKGQDKSRSGGSG
jgi:rfaE bifunctional protein nucleotidyltransferase chain/domain